MLKKMVVLLIVCLGMASCRIHKLKVDVEKQVETWEVYGEVEIPEKLEGQLIAVVYGCDRIVGKASEYKGRSYKIAGYKVVDPAVKVFAIFLDPGIYRFALIHDRNGNFEADPDEPVYVHDHGHRLKFSDVVKQIDLALDVPTEGRLPKKFPRNFNVLPPQAVDTHHLAFGEMMDLEDPRFSMDAGKLGLWQSAAFLKQYGAGLYWRDPYDPNRIPVLFVSGAGGSAQEWRFFFDNLDTEKFQAWYWLYPSGMRISFLGYYLNRWIERMARIYSFERIYIVAHSMGGLVSREAIVSHLKRADADDSREALIQGFVTISTPWNGHSLAKKGVENLARPVPSWHDVIPGSKFLQTVFAYPLKGRIEHHLLFGYTENSGDDGTVALSSVLLDEAQKDAVEVHGYMAEHVDILFKDEVFEHVQEILYRSEAKLAESGETPAPPPVTATDSSVTAAFPHSAAGSPSDAIGADTASVLTDSDTKNPAVPPSATAGTDQTAPNTGNPSAPPSPGAVTSDGDGV